MAVNLHLNNSQILNNLLGFLKLSSSKVVVSKKKKVSPIGLKGPVLEYSDGTVISGLLTVAKQLVRMSDIPETPYLLGTSTAEKAEIHQWLDFSTTHVRPVLEDTPAMHNIIKMLDTVLEDKVYFVTHSFSLADIMMFHTVSAFMGTLSFSEKEKYLHFSRWYDQVQHHPRVRQKTPYVYFHKKLLFYC